MTERWRCFVAAPISDSLRSEVASAVAAWRSRDDLAAMRWSAPESWHLTFAFLGSIDAARVARAREAIALVCPMHAPMRISTGGLGAFPNPRRARVAWYGVDASDARLRDLAADLARALGTEAAEPFRPHLTLARARSAPVDLRAWLADAASSAPSAGLEIDRVELLRSHLGGGPPRYERLMSVKLGSPNQ
jgi:RNA 2',3'-cyclic 3'-phosphodiesterase